MVTSDGEQESEKWLDKGRKVGACWENQTTPSTLKTKAGKQPWKRIEEIKGVHDGSALAGPSTETELRGNRQR
jgi:hypothetical protein